MLSEIKEAGPGFEYFLSTPCKDWDAVQYHKAWKNGLDKAIVTRSFKKQIQKIKEEGTEEEKEKAIRLEEQFNVESKKKGHIDNFWLKSLPGPKRKLAEDDKINAESVFISCDLQFGGTSCNNEVQFGGTKNNFQEHKQPYENQPGLDDEINNFFKNSGEQSANSFKKRLKLEVDDEKDDNTDSEESEDSGSEYVPEQSESDLESEYIPSDTDGPKPGPKPAPKPAPLLLPSKLKYFIESYTKMNESKKWLLSSGTCVEDVLFRGGKALSNESLIHSWTIDLSDWETKELFSEKDWREIKKVVFEQPLVDENFARSLSRFRNVRTTTDLRKVLESTSYRDKNEQYDRESHFDAEWAELVMRNFLMLYEDPDEALRKKHLEGWFDANIWSAVIDRAFSNVRGLQTVRKESSSISVAKRKNRKRARKERTKIGRKLDGIFRTYDDDIEYGAIEVKSEFVQVNSTDRLKDGLKLGKAMHDMLVCLTHLVKLDEKKVRQLQVIGLQHSGLKLQICQLSTKKGYVSVLKRGELYKIPKKIEEIKDLIMLLSGVWRAKKMVINCMEVINMESMNSTEDEFVQSIVNSGTTTPPTVSLAWSFDT